MTIGLASIKETRPVGLAAPTRHHLLSSPVHFGPQQTNCCADGSKHAKTHGIPWFLHHLHQNSWDSWVFMPLKMGFNVLINNQMAVGWILSIRFGGHFRWFLGFKHIRIYEDFCDLFDLVNGHGDVDKSWRNSGVRTSHGWVDEFGSLLMVIWMCLWADVHGFGRFWSRTYWKVLPHLKILSLKFTLSSINRLITAIGIVVWCHLIFQHRPGIIILIDPIGSQF